MFSSVTAIALALSAQQALAHIMLKSPPGLRSKNDPQVPEGDIDYSLTNPLDKTGANYPCKGYNTPERIASLNPVATLQAGGNLQVTLEGSATHEGGSCQFSLSYDGGETWGVIASVQGGCPLPLSYDIKIPAGLPSHTKALFGWTWNNKVGNREEYMDCAVVDVQGGSSAISLPGVWRANTLGDQCVVPEGVEVIFPNPGDQVLGTIPSGTPTQLSPCNYNQDTTVTLGAGGKKGAGSKRNKGISRRVRRADSKGHKRVYA